MKSLHSSLFLLHIIFSYRPIGGLHTFYIYSHTFYSEKIAKAIIIFVRKSEKLSRYFQWPDIAKIMPTSCL